MNIVEKIREFHQGLERQDAYDFYELMAALASPACGNRLYMTDGTTVNLKRIVRRLRITVMQPRFDVDYATAYSPQEAFEEWKDLKEIYLVLNATERNAVSKIIGALEIISKAQPALEQPVIKTLAQIDREQAVQYRTLKDKAARGDLITWKDFTR